MSVVVAVKKERERERNAQDSFLSAFNKYGPRQNSVTIMTGIADLTKLMLLPRGNLNKEFTR